MDEAPAFHFFIDRYTAFIDTIFLDGWAYAPDRAITAIALHIPGVDPIALHEIGLPSPDVAARYGAGAAAVRFQLRARLAPHFVGAPGTGLLVTFDDGGSALIDDPGLRENQADPVHALFREFLALLAARGSGRVLEMGSRARSGITRREFVPPSWSYTGFDIMTGPNVDVVGDAHALGAHFPHASFDAAFSISVFEHLLMPWKVVTELNTVLSTGAPVFVFTHQAWPVHDAPWDYWRFSNTAWRGLFNERTGFEIVAAVMGEPAYIVPRIAHGATAFDEGASGFLASGVIARKTGPTSLRWDVDTAAIVADSYPETTGVAQL